MSIAFRLPSAAARLSGSARLLLVSAAAAAALAGCASGNIAMVATIAGGEKINVPIGRGGAELTNVAGVQIKKADFTLDPAKKLVFAFEFADSRRRPLRRVHVEDVSDNAPVTFVDDTQPAVSAAGEWRGETAPIEIGDPRLAWMATISNTLRVFRFTLTFADGQTLVIHQGAFYPAGIKSVIRQSAGLKY